MLTGTHARANRIADPRQRSDPAGGPAPTRTTHPYPTLAFIERALAAPAGVLSGAPDADRLERRARALAAEYWSDTVWLTGVVPEAAFRRVLGELAPALAEVTVRVVERPTRP